MSKSHTWFATQSDTALIMRWLRDAGARRLNGDTLDCECEADGSEHGLHFPAIGPVKVLPDRIPIPECGDNSPAAKRAILAAIRQQENPGRPQIDVDHSAVAGIVFPQLRDSRYWQAGHVWFPTSRLKDVFPELNRICGRFERFLEKNPVVFDNRKGENKTVFDYQICRSGVMHRLFALPEAYALLNKGEFMVDYLVSPKQYSEFRRRL
jgi:hypothetical protein